jgi:hypothetical protein
MKHGIELNGVANALVLLQVEVDKTDDGRLVMNKETYDSMVNNLQLLERYMLAYCEAVNNGTTVPHWYDVRENPKDYPSNRERHGG